MNYENLELIVRKKKSSFLERLLQYLGYDFSHDRYKAIIYGESSTETEKEETIKNYYDAYTYLLSNYKNVFTTEIFKRFLYIFTGSEVEYSILTRICNLFYNTNDLPPIERGIKFHVLCYEQMPEFDESTRQIISLMLFNFTLVKCGIPSISMTRNQYAQHYVALTKYINGDTVPMFDVITNVMKYAKFQKKSYYKKLIPQTASDICQKILEDQEMLEKEYKIKSISLYGSFSKNINRIDSDVDLMVVFEQFIPLETRQETIAYLMQHYFDVFHRFIDICEVSAYLNDSMLKETKKHKKIF